MHDHENEHGEDSQRPDDNPSSESDPLPETLLNWQVLEIEGEATLVEEVTAPVSPEPEPFSTSTASDASSPEGSQSIADQLDDIIVVSVAHRHLTLNPGDTAVFQATILNNGPDTANFRVYVEGWIDASWVEAAPIQLRIPPGERAPVSLNITPPRLPSTSAGERALAILVDSPTYPDRLCRLGVQITLRPFGDFVLGEPRPAQPSVGWFRRHATLMAPLANRSNRRLEIDLQADVEPGRASASRQCSFEFRTPDAADFQAGQTRISVEAGQSLPVEVRVIPHSQPIFGLENQVTPLRISAQEADTETPAQQAHAELHSTPLIRPWHVASASSLVVLAILLVGFIVLAALLLVPLAANQLPSETAPAAAPVAIVLKISEPLPTRPADAAQSGQPATQNAAPGVNPPSVTTGNLGVGAPRTQTGSLLVQPGMVSQPGVVDPSNVTAPTGALPPDAAPASSAAPSASTAPEAAPSAGSAGSSSAKTYAEMFREVGLRYDIDWRLLAAQAYVESGFNSLALGSSGDLGLMQILPATWNEWAPTVGASDPFDSQSNSTVAAVYLDYLRTELAANGYPDPRWMLVAYNWGPNETLGFLRSGGAWETLPDVRSRYALDILRIAETIPAN